MDLLATLKTKTIMQPTTFSASLLTYLAEALRSLNLSLVDSPPPGTEQTGHDVCFLGPNEIIHCRDLEDGKRFSIGSWYISPERHVLEYIAVSTLCLTVLHLTLPILRKYQYHYQPEKRRAQKQQQPIRPPFLIRAVTLITVLLQVYYKSLGYSGKLYFWVMPCNMNWILCFLLSFYPNLSYTASHAVLQMCISFSGLAVVALASPDTSDLVLPGEVPYFFISHVVLALYPFYFVATRQVSTLPSKHQRNVGSVIMYFVAWFLFTCSVFGLFYFTFVTPLSIYSGLNLNYMLSPPANQYVVEGDWYRILSCK